MASPGRRTPPPRLLVVSSGAALLGVLQGAAPLGALGAQASCTPIPLRDALEQVAAVGRVRLSYSRELLAVDRLVCPSSAGAPTVAALDSLLRGTGVEAVPVGSGQIVLAPAAHTADAPTVATRTAVLDRVVVTGSPAGAPSRSLPVALSVIDGSRLGARATASLAGTLDGTVPGLWLWSQPTTSLLARYAGLRGASSFGLTTPKLYLDGVEVANPLFVTALTPDQVERVEVIRGPQGAALYGADAISGVINVITRHDGAPNGGLGLTLRSGIGAAGTSSLVPRPAFAQDHGATIRVGGGAQTAGLSVGVSTLGPVVPGSTARQITSLADARKVTRAGVFTVTARFADAVAPPNYALGVGNGTPGGTTLGGPTTLHADRLDTLGLSHGMAGVPDTALSRQHVSELTLAATAVSTNAGRWTHTVTGGVDAYRLSGVSTNFMAAIASPLDSAQKAARGSAARGTLRASSTATYDATDALAVTVTGIADLGVLRDATQLDDPRAAPGYGAVTYSAGTSGLGAYAADGTGYAGGTRVATPVTTLSTAGLVGQTTLAWNDALFVTAGLRAERNDGFTAASRAALLPSLGVSSVQPLGGALAGATLKLRAAYGSGLRPARSAARLASWKAFGGGSVSSSLAPESQTGVEGGADLFGAGAHAFALHVTAFDQRASNLIQQVARMRGEADGYAPGQGAPGEGAWPGMLRHFDYALENVGVIANRGVEGEAQMRAFGGGAGALTLSATTAYVDSRVRRVAAGYAGDLRPGDRVLEVPRWTFGANAAWRGGAWSATLGAARAADWVNYDRLALAAAVASGRTDAQLTGDALRAYWRNYPGITRLRADVVRDLSRGLSAVLTGENLLDRQRGEPDNITVLPGRTITAGVRAQF